MTATAPQGKRLATRLILGVVLIATVIVTTLVDVGSKLPRIAPWVAAAVAMGALFEYAAMLSVDATRRRVFDAMLLGGAMIVLVRPVTVLLGIDCGVAGPLSAALVAFALVGMVSVWSHRHRDVTPESLRDLSGAFLGLSIVPLPLAILVEIGCLQRPHGAVVLGDAVGPYLLLFALFTSKLNDMGGYLVGIAIGRTKLCPGVSPNKSVEGAVGGMLLSATGAVLASSNIAVLSSLGIGPMKAVVFAIVVSVATITGDLLESLIKRAVRVKDSASLLPAFGGLFDLVDSFIFAAPAGYTLLRAWLAP